MKFSSKLTIALATAGVICPMAAYAAPITGSTAATVSIKFQDSGATRGNYSIVPGGNANGSGNGVKELSAAVATGETGANATSASTLLGTSATASGFSAPVTFSYSNTSDVSNVTKNVEFANSSKSQRDSASQSASSQDGFTKTASGKSSESANSNNAAQNAANQAANASDSAASAASGKSSESASAGNSTSAASAKAAGSLGTNITANGVTTFGAGSSEAARSAGASNTASAKAAETASNTATQKGSASSSANNSASNSASNSAKAAETASLDTAQKNAASQSANSQNGSTVTATGKNADVNNSTKTNLNYQYTGSSAGLSFIPANR